MKQLKIVLSALFVFGVISPVTAGDIAAGRNAANFFCAECHGANGISVIENFPNLAGQKEAYLVAQLKAFKADRRKDPEMNLMAKQLSDADVLDVAAFYASLSCGPNRGK
jgi:cytochrome c553